MVSDARPAPHLLYVAWGFPPSRSGGVHRAIATTNAFARAGWDVTVLTAPREVFADLTGADESLEKLVDPRVEVVRVPFSRPAMQVDVRTYSLARLLFPRLWAKARARLDVVTFPEPGYGSWRRPIERAALAVHTRHPVDLVIGTTNPHVSVAPGMRLSADHGVPHVVDCRDAWLLHTYSGERVQAAHSPAGRWEARAFASATEIWFVNEPLRRWHAQAHPGDAERMHVVMNGYDTDMELPPRPGATADEPVRFGYVGTITTVMPLAEFVEGWRYGHAHEPTLANANVDLYGYLGYFATPHAAIAAELDAARDAQVRYLGPVSKTQLAKTYAGFDVLVLILGGGEYVTSGKVFEYMSTGLPVVSVLTPGGAAADVLREYPRWHPAVDLTPAAVAAALAAAAADARRADGGRAAEARAAARRFRRDLQLAPRIEALGELVSAHSAAAARPGASDGAAR